MNINNDTKIVSLQELGEIVKELKNDGKKIAHSHGCFDLLHPGHIKHFEAAKKMADVLVVTLTQDKFVNKGPGRPVFNEIVRAESIAALESVDYVAINKWPTAIETIKLIKPDFYIKGQDYKNREEDVTKNIYFEEDAVKEIGGDIRFTEEITFSSSKLINAHMSQLDDSVQSFLSELKSKYEVNYIIKCIEGLNNIRVLVIGDTIIDEYHTCVPLGKSSKSPTISTIYQKGESYAGGVLAIANHLEQFAGKVNLFTVLGGENSQVDLIERKLSPNISKNFFYRSDGTTNTKRRYLDTYLNIKLFEVTFMNDKYIDKSLEKEIIEHLKRCIDEQDMILLADFGHGFITPDIIEFLEKSGKFLAVNAQTNSNNYGFNYITKYNKVNYISIDEKELRLPFGDSYGRVETLIDRLIKITNCNKIQITLGAKGSLFYDNGKYFQTPAFATSIKDSVGAGDAVLSITSLCAFKNYPSDIIPFIGNCVGAIAVQIIGNEHPVYKRDLSKFITHFIK